MCSIQSCLKPGHFLYIYEDGILGTKVCIPSDLLLGLILFPFIQNFLRVVMQGLNWACSSVRLAQVLKDWYICSICLVLLFMVVLFWFWFSFARLFFFLNLLFGHINSWEVLQVTSQPDWRKKIVGPSLYLDHSWFPCFSSVLELFSFTVSALLDDTRIDFAGFDYRKECRP